jgi:hypothetical protein
MDCGGGSICVHKRERSKCMDCGGGSICVHQRIRSTCMDCEGSQICVHRRYKTRCSVCNPQSKKLCRHGCGTLLSKGRKEHHDSVCAACTGRITQNQRKEYKFLAKLESWGFYPSVHDKTVKDDNCKPVNRRRADYLYVTGDDLKYNILVECDENSHSGIDIDCEMKRLGDVYVQIVANTNVTKPLLVIRFNPDAKEDIDDELKSAIQETLQGGIEVNSGNGVNVYTLIGYSESRKQAYIERKLLIKI